MKFPFKIISRAKYTYFTDRIKALEAYYYRTYTLLEFYKKQEQDYKIQINEFNNSVMLWQNKTAKLLQEKEALEHQLAGVSDERDEYKDLYEKAEDERVFLDAQLAEAEYQMKGLIEKFERQKRDIRNTFLSDEELSEVFKSADNKNDDKTEHAFA